MTQSDIYSNPTAPTVTAAPHRSKVALTWLAFLLGAFGAQWWYLRRPKAWMVTAFAVVMLILARLSPSWWDNPYFLLLIVPTSAGFIEALVFALTADEQFDAKYNPASDRKTHTGWNAVIPAIVTTLVGGFIVVFGIAMTVMYVYTAMGWLDGYVL